MTREEIIGEFREAVQDDVFTDIKNNVDFEPSVYLLLANEDDECSIVKKDLPPTVIPKNLEDTLQLAFVKFTYDKIFKEIKDNKQTVLGLIHAEIFSENDKNVLFLISRDEEGKPLPKLYEIIQKDMKVNSKGLMEPTVVDLVQIEQ